MDNRTDTSEDFQSTPEHLANRVGGPGFAQDATGALDATPGGMSKALLDAEHDRHTAATDFGRTAQDEWVGSESSEQRRSDGSSWRDRVTQGANALRSRPYLLMALGAVALVGIVALMRSRADAR